MKNLRHFFSLVLAICMCNISFAQQANTLRGTIVDDFGAPVVGASVSLKGTTTGTASDQSGAFTLPYSAPATLRVTALGYVDQEIALTNQTTLTIRLVASSEMLDEVVVVGYGTQKKGDVTSAIASVKAEDFTKGTVRDAAQLIQGKVAGLRITTPSGDPTASTQINLRGINSINGSSAPLVLIDGVPGDIGTVAPEDIEAVDVLKDGSAAAMYGTRATGGVIMITTRQNRSGAPRTNIEYNNYVNFQRISRVPQMMTAADYRRLIADGHNYEDHGGNTNWIDAVLQNPISHNHNLSFSGGNSQTNFTGSINYRNWEGIFLRSGQERLNVRTSLNHNMFDGKLSTNIQLISQNASSNQGGGGGAAWRQAIIRNPTDVPQNPDGTWKEGNAYVYDNPLGLIHESINDARFRETRLNGSMTYRPISDLSLKVLLSRVQNNGLNGSSTTFQHVNTTKNNLRGTANRSTNSNVENLMELTANYNKSFNDHRISVLGGYSWQDNTSESFNAYNFDFPTDSYSYHNLGIGRALKEGRATMSSAKSKWQLAGFFGRVNYFWKDRYMVTASVRREGSSTFGENYRWGTFPAASVAWNIANEDFMSSVKGIQELKLRAGFGVTGTIASSPYQSQTSYNFSEGAGAFVNGRWEPGFIPARNFNPDLRWEKKEEWNVGLDYGILNNRVTGQLDYYVRHVKDLLYSFSVPVPPYLTNSMLINAGEMKNSGFEALVNVRAIEKDNFKWNTSVTFANNKNTLVNLSNDQFEVTTEFFDAGHTGEPIQVSTHRVKVGGPIGQFFVYKSVGVDDNGKWLVENRDGEIIPIANAAPEDRHYYGNGIPKQLLSWNNSFEYKQFDLSINLRGAYGHQILNMQRMYYENPVNKAYNVLKTAYDPVYGKELKNDLVYVSHYIEDGDYLKLDNVTLGYNFQPKAIRGISDLRVYVSALNLHTFTKYKGIDPEGVNFSGGNTFSPGIDNRDKYPTTRTFTVGLNVKF